MIALKTAAIVAFSALAFSLPALTGAETRLTYESRNGHGTLTLPYIGSPAYSHSCTITEAWGDGSALAYCTEDGATYVYDPDGQPYANDAGVPIRDAGWYPVN